MDKQQIYRETKNVCFPVTEKIGNFSVWITSHAHRYLVVHRKSYRNEALAHDSVFIGYRILMSINKYQSVSLFLKILLNAKIDLIQLKYQGDKKCKYRKLVSKGFLTLPSIYQGSWQVVTKKNLTEPEWLSQVFLALETTGILTDYLMSHDIF